MGSILKNVLLYFIGLMGVTITETDAFPETESDACAERSPGSNRVPSEPARASADTTYRIIVNLDAGPEPLGTMALPRRQREP